MTTSGVSLSSAQLAEGIRSEDYSHASATVLGYGNMGKQFVRALQKLGVPKIRVCSRSNAPLSELQCIPEVRVVSGGYQAFSEPALSGELGIVATPTADLTGAASHLINLGFRKLLIEKPVSLESGDIEALAVVVERKGVDAACAYNRLAYPSFHEVRHRANEDGGITSCHYTFTEFVHRIGPGQFSNEELLRWGTANSLHVLSMAHGLIGLPESWHSFREGSISWHPSGAVFVGAGISSRRIPFSYHTDWGSTGRWSVELHTREASYRLCPLESAFKKTSAAGDWEELPLSVTAPEIKAGVVEEVAAMLMQPEARILELPTLTETAKLTKYAEHVFGYGV